MLQSIFIAGYDGAMNHLLCSLILAQAPEPVMETHWTSIFTDLFWLSIGFIFLSAIIGAIIARRRKDRCLKLFDEDHVTMQISEGRVVWGDLHVYSQGMELRYDVPYRTSAGLSKSSYLLYQNEMGQLAALARYDGDLPDDEKRRRKRQVRWTCNPTLLRRMRRSFYNLFNTIRDAFVQVTGMFIGQIARTSFSQSMQAQEGQVQKIGTTLLGAVGNAYEPMLERLIGKPVVLELRLPTDPQNQMVELPGYLAEYSQQFVAVFNLEHDAAQVIELSTDQPESEHQVTIAIEDQALVVRNDDDTPLVVESMTDGQQTWHLGMTLNHGASARIRKQVGAMMLRLIRCPRIDIICPRHMATVRHASHADALRERATHLAPMHEDNTPQFP